MKGSESKILNYMEGANNRYVIPVYQRKYSWKEENCRQLYEDLKKIITDRRGNHFFGSLVSSVIGNGATTEYHIIDGQQRLTTVTLLLLAIRNLAMQKKVIPADPSIPEQINELYLVSKWAKEGDKIKLRPVDDDREALYKLFGDEEDYDPSSKLTLNYKFFCSMILREEVTVDELFDALKKLEIISITLDQGDNAQMIFESLNSTGLALEEGDKIRNYILMGLSPKEQDDCYRSYWVKIEACTGGDVSGFVRDYLSIKQQVTPKIDNVYQAFKGYAQKEDIPIETLLSEMLKYARLYEKLLICKSGFNEYKTRLKLDDCLYRMKRLEIVVTRPFLMEVLRLVQDKKITEGEALSVFEITENYLFRRNICEVPTNALSKIFLNLNREVLRYDNTSSHYVDKFIYALRIKKDSGRFPDDAEFTQALAAKQVYQMRGKYKAYLFERFENYGTIETKDVYTHLDNNIYTIEHIMPQHLTPAWTDALGENADQIHETWLHRLANLTLTGYNPNLSNKPFAEKRDAEEGGYKASGLRMTLKISQKESWGLPELKERNDEMIAQAVKIWSLPETDYEPVKKEYDSFTLDDENVDFTGLDIAKYSYQNTEQPVTSWADMFEHVVGFLHSKDRSVLSDLAYGVDATNTLVSYVSSEEEVLRSPLKIDDHIYIEKNTSTAMKISMLRRLFVLYDADPMDLVFYLKDAESEKLTEVNRHELRKKYWAYALPMIQKQNVRTGAFSKVKSITSNTISGFFGISGFSVACIANFDQARIDFYLSKGDAAENKAAFDELYAHKAEIERSLGVSLKWERADQNKASWISYSLNDVSIGNEADWPRMAKFHANWSDKICREMLSYLKEYKEEKDILLEEVAGIFREWALLKDGVNVNLSKCATSLTRFTTDAMSEILPDLKDVPSGWNTDNHYFYEIANYTGNSVYIQFALNSQNITDEFREICDRINELYPSKIQKKEEWVWRKHFKTSVVTFSEEISKEEIFAGLDACFEEIRQFERDLAQKLAAYDS